MNGYSTIITIIVVVIVMKIFNRIFQNRKVKTEASIPSNVIRQPKPYLYVGIVCFIVMAANSIFAYVSEPWPANIFYGVLIALLSLPSIWIILLSINWKIEIGETEFTYRNSFRI